MRKQQIFYFIQDLAVTWLPEITSEITINIIIYLAIFQAMIHKSNQISYIIRHFDIIRKTGEKSYSIIPSLDQNVLFRYTEITAEWKLFQFQMPKTILCITNKHKTLLYYKQLKEISVNSNLSLVISEVILADVCRNHRHSAVF